MEPAVNIEYYENEHEFGLRFPAGIEPGELLKIVRQHKNLQDQLPWTGL